MKQVLSLFLTLTLCVSLFACRSVNSSNNQDNTHESSQTTGSEGHGSMADYTNAIVGEWKAFEGNQSILFVEDGTGKWNDESFTWKYDTDLSCYVIATSTIQTTSIKVEDDNKYLTLSDIKYYTPSHFQILLETFHQDHDNEIAQILNGMTKLEVGKQLKSDSPSLSSVFSGVSWENSNILISFEVTNNSPSWHDGVLLEYCQWNGFCFTDYGKTPVGMSMWSVTRIDTGETMPVTYYMSISGPGNIQTAIDLYGELIGIIYFEYNGTTYYIDFSDYLK